MYADGTFYVFHFRLTAIVLYGLRWIQTLGTTTTLKHKMVRKIIFMFLISLCHILFVTNYAISSFFVNPASTVDRTPGASSLQCLSSIVDRLSSVNTGVAMGMRNMVALSPTGSDSQCSSPDSPSNRPVYHVLWEGVRANLNACRSHCMFIYEVLWMIW